MDTSNDDDNNPNDNNKMLDKLKEQLNLMTPNISLHISQPTIDIYPIENYTFGSKSIKLDKDINVKSRLERLQENYIKRGIRRTVEAILLVHNHGHPHVLLLQIGGKTDANNTNTNTKSFYKLPGGRLKVGEEEMNGLHRKLSNKLGSPIPDLIPKWSNGTLLSVLHRPNFDDRLYPYKIPHITQHKEIKKLYLVPLPPKCMFAVAENIQFIAVPFFELYNNQHRYGSILASIPQLLSKYRINSVS